MIPIVTYFYYSNCIQLLSFTVILSTVIAYSHFGLSHFVCSHFIPWPFSMTLKLWSQQLPFRETATVKVLSQEPISSNSKSEKSRFGMRGKCFKQNYGRNIRSQPSKINLGGYSENSQILVYNKMSSFF
jgi:hypothetical protein